MSPFQTGPRPYKTPTLIMKFLISLGPLTAVAATLASAELAPAGEPAVTGTITGKIVFEGDKPEIKPLTIGADQSKGCCDDGVSVDDTDYSLVVGEGGGIQYAVVTLEVKDAKAEIKDEPVVLDQQGCRFLPHLIVVPVGQKISYKNSDTVSHNVHTYPIKNTPLNQTVAAGGALEASYTKAEEIKVGCDIHPWMASYVVVTDASHFAVTDATGAFSLPNVPPGKYKVEVWHEKLGKAKFDAVVNEDGSSEAIEHKMGAKKKKGGRRGR